MAYTQKIKIINILLSSIDGKIAAHEFESTQDRLTSNFTNEYDFKHLQTLTSDVDAVFIGAKSLNVEKGAFRVADLRADKKEPHWFVFTKTGKVDKFHPFWSQKNIPKSVYHYTSTSELKSFLNSLSEQNIKKVALLGGSKLNALFWNEGLVDELHLTISPYMIGKCTAPQLIHTTQNLETQLRLIDIKEHNSFLFLHYKVIKNEQKYS